MPPSKEATELPKIDREIHQPAGSARGSSLTSTPTLSKDRLERRDRSLDLEKK